jgi:hypothetical protein
VGVPRILAVVTAVFFLQAWGAEAQDITGVWQAREGNPSGYFNPGSSDVQTLFLTPEGQYRREIVVEGGNGSTGAAGKIVDQGSYRFTPPQAFQYVRQSWTLCTALRCGPGTPIGPQQATLPFALVAPNRAQFIGLVWTKIR